MEGTTQGQHCTDFEQQFNRRLLCSRSAPVCVQGGPQSGCSNLLVQKAIVEPAVTLLVGIALAP